MPTASGLPKVGEVWERREKLPPDWAEQVIRFRVTERGTGAYWALRVEILEPVQPPRFRNQLWVDASYWFSRGELHLLHEAAMRRRT